MSNEINTGDNASLPIKEVQFGIDALFIYLRNVLYAPKQAMLNPESLPEPFRDLAQGILVIGEYI